MILCQNVLTKFILQNYQLYKMSVTRGLQEPSKILHSHDPHSLELMLLEDISWIIYRLSCKIITTIWMLLSYSLRVHLEHIWNVHWWYNSHFKYELMFGKFFEIIFGLNAVLQIFKCWCYLGVVSTKAASACNICGMLM